MGIRINKRSLFLLVTTVVLAGTVLALNKSSLFTLRRVSIDGAEVNSREAAQMGLQIGENALCQDLHAAAHMMSQRVGIGKVRVQLAIPHEVAITTNDFQPVASVYDPRQKRILYLDDHGRVAPFDSSRTPVGPLFTGITNLHVFETPADTRVANVLSQLFELSRDYPEVYETISEIDFSQMDFITVTFTSHEFSVLATPDRLARSLRDISRITNGASAAVMGASIIDARFDGLLTVRTAATPDMDIVKPQTRSAL